MKITSSSTYTHTNTDTHNNNHHLIMIFIIKLLLNVKYCTIITIKCVVLANIGIFIRFNRLLWEVECQLSEENKFFLFADYRVMEISKVSFTWALLSVFWYTFLRVSNEKDGFVGVRRPKHRQSQFGKKWPLLKVLWKTLVYSAICWRFRRNLEMGRNGSSLHMCFDLKDLLCTLNSFLKDFF